MQSIKEIYKVPASAIHRIHELAAVIWPASFAHILSTEQIDYMMNRMYALPVLEKEYKRGVEFYILKYDNEEVGYTAIELMDQQSWKLHKIYLSHTMHGKGLGKYQLQTMETIVKNYGAAYLYLNVNRHNKAIDFYKSQGYEIVKEEDIDIGNGYWMNDYKMRKKIS